MATSITIHFLLVGLPFWIILMVAVFGTAYSQREFVRVYMPERASNLHCQVLTEMVPALTVTFFLLVGVLSQSRLVYVMGVLPLVFIAWIWFDNFIYVQGQPTCLVTLIVLLYVTGVLMLIQD